MRIASWMGGNPLDQIFSGNQNVPRLGIIWGKRWVKNSKFFVEDPNWKLRHQKSWLWGGWKETAPTKSQCFTHLFSSHLLGVVILLMEEILHQLIGSLYGWWFQICYIFIPTWGKWFNLTIAYFCKWVGTKTTNQLSAFFRQHLSNSMDPTITGLGANRKESLFCRGGLTSVPSVRVPSWASFFFECRALCIRGNSFSSRVGWRPDISQSAEVCVDTRESNVDFCCVGRLA